ncbi:MAG: hypothetical protein CMH57_09140 [Myxococcales bacterium]|nr:hypothetical protein [Myxococcales bacterium]
MSRRDVLTLALTLTVSVGVSPWGCTCGDAAVEEAPEEAPEGGTSGGAAEAPQGTPEQPGSAKEATGATADTTGSDKPGEDAQGAPDKASEGAPVAFASIRIEQIQESLKADGWKLIGEPKNTETAGIKYTLFSIIKPPRGGAVMLYDYQDQPVARNFEEHMRKQAAAGGAVRREGGRVLAVTIPRHPKEAERLLLKLAGEPSGADATPEPTPDAEAQP